jgi:hypothetical protein
MKFAICCIVLFLFATVFPHSGGLDASGGHYNRKTGVYHVHRTEKKQNETKATHSVNSNSGIRHNSSCRYFNCNNCVPAGANDGVRACKICGG